MVQIQTQYICESCRTPYSTIALAKKCEGSPVPEMPIWPKPGDQIKLLNSDGKTFTQVTFKKWILTISDKILNGGDEETLSLSNDYEFHEWHLGLAAPVILFPNWKEGRWTVPLNYAKTPRELERLTRKDLIGRDLF